MEESEFLKMLGAQIKRFRKEAKLTQPELGYRCDFEYTAIGRIEAGRTNPTIITLKKIAEALEMPLTQLLSFELNV